MKRLLAILFLAPSLAFAAPPVRGINQQGTAGAPVAVSTATKVVPGDPNRLFYCLVPEEAAVRCEYGGIDDSAPSAAANAPNRTPTGSVGFYISGGTYYCESRTPSATWSDITVQRRLDCAAVTGTVHIDTNEHP